MRADRKHLLSSVQFWAWFFRALLLLNLIPLAVIAFCDHASADDYAFSNYPHHAWEATHSLIAFFEGCARQFHWNYFSWQGCFGAVILGTLDPLAFGTQYYVLVPFLLIGFFVLSNFVFWRTLAFHVIRWKAPGRLSLRSAGAAAGHSSVFDGKSKESDSDKEHNRTSTENGKEDTERREQKRAFRSYGDIAASLSSLIGIELVPRALDMFFWWDGAVNYLPFFSFLLLLGAVLIRLYDDADDGHGSVREKRRFPVWMTVLGCILSFVFVSGNYVTALMNLLILIAFGLLLLYRGIHRRENRNRGITSFGADVKGHEDAGTDNISGCSRNDRRRDGRQRVSIPYCLMLLSAIAGFLVSVLAPGNSARIDDEGAAGITSIPSLILTSLRLAADSVQDSVTVLLVLFLLMAVPFFWKMVQNRAGIPAILRIPAWLFYTALFLIYAAGFAPSVYVYGDGGPMRVVDVRYFYFTFFAMLGELYAIAKLSLFMERKRAGNECHLTARYMCGMLISALLFTGLYYLAPRENREVLTSVCAARSVLIGEAQQYDREMKERERILQDPATEGQDVTITAVTARPKLLFLSGLEMTESPDNWINQTVAVYYDKASVTLSY